MLTRMAQTLISCVQLHLKRKVKTSIYSALQSTCPHALLLGRDLAEAGLCPDGPLAKRDVGQVPSDQRGGGFWNRLK